MPAQALSNLPSLAEEIFDLARPLAPERAEAAAAEAREVAQNSRRPARERAGAWHLLEIIAQRRGNPEEALSAARHSLNLAPSHAMQNNVASHLMDLGQVPEAVQTLLGLLAVPGNHHFMTLLNLAEGLGLLGLVDDARDAYAEAEGMVALDATTDFFVLARAGAAAGFNQEALAHFARFVALRVGASQTSSPVALIQTHREEVAIILSERSSLRRLVGMALRSAETYERLCAQGEAASTPEADAEALRVFEEMAPYRARANAAALGHGER